MLSNCITNYKLIDGITYGFLNKNLLNSSHRYITDNNFSLSENEKNILSLSNQLNIKNDTLSFLKQIHSNIAIERFVDNISIKFEADAHFTKIPNIFLTVQTADCVPILLYNKKDNIISAIHSGWRGAFSNIIENTINAMNLSSIPETIAIIGPHIFKDNYEVGKDFFDSFLTCDSSYNKFFENINNGKFLFDIKQFVHYKLQVLGITNIIDVNINTFTDNNFFSYRRYTNKIDNTYGSNISYISLC